MNTKQFILTFILMFGLAGVQTYAQDDNSPAAEEAVIPADRYDRGTPQRSGDGFMAIVETGDYETAAEYMDLRNLRGEASDLSGAQLARRLYVIIQRATWVDVNDLVDDPAGRSNDGLPDYRDSIGIVLDGDKEVRLLMQKVPGKDGVSIWKISNATVSLIPKLYSVYGFPDAIESLRRSLPHVSFLGFELFKWVTIIAVGTIVYLAVLLMALVVRRLLGNPQLPKNRRLFNFLARPVGIWVVIVTVNAVGIGLGQGATAETISRVSPVPILVTLWMLFAGVNLIRDAYANHLRQAERSGAAVLLQPASNAIKLMIAVSAALVYLDDLGINITTVLAGLGVGGIAVALALQKPMEDVFGALTLYTQQPIRVGDFCRIGTTTGTIEEIGLRTTRLRTLENTVVAVPNAQLANAPIDNISARRKIRFRPILRLRYDTTPEQIRKVLGGIRELISSHEQVLPDSQRVRFKEISDDALLIEVNSYLDTTDWATYLELTEELNIQILEIVTQAGTSLSPPARVLHIEQTTD
jgi:MscS family membrane protein